MNFIKFAKVRDVKSPEHGTSGSNGIDFFVPNDFEEKQVIFGEDILIPSGIKFNLPEEHCILLLNKSGIARNFGLDVGACLIDSDYQGEVHLHLFHVKDPGMVITIKPGLKLVQGILLYAPTMKLNELNESELYSEKTFRGTGGFGSTGD